MNNVFSQAETDSLIINSLSCFNKVFFLNLEKYGQYILVIYDNKYYVFDKYYDKEKKSGTRIQITYKLTAIDSDKYRFSLELAGTEYCGSFYYKNGKIKDLDWDEIHTDRWSQSIKE